MSNGIYSVTTRDGVQLRVKDWGAGRPVVLIHGWALSSTAALTDCLPATSSRSATN